MLAALGALVAPELRGAQVAADRVQVERVILYQPLDVQSHAPKGFILDVQVHLELTDATQATLNPEVSLPNYLETHATLGEFILKPLGGRIDGALLSALATADFLKEQVPSETRRVISHTVSFFSEAAIPARSVELHVQVVRRKSDAARWVTLATCSTDVGVKVLNSPESGIPATRVKSYSEERVEAGGAAKKAFDVWVLSLPRPHAQSVLAGRAKITLDGADPLEVRVGGLDAVLLRFSGAQGARPGKFDLLYSALSVKCPLLCSDK